MKKQAICVVMGMFCLLSAHGQNSSMSQVNNPISPSLGVLVGTTGVGLEFYHPLGNQFGVQAGFSLMPFDTQIIGDYGEYQTRSQVSARVHNAHILLGWTPFHHLEGFFRHFVINAGAGYFLQAKGDIHTILNESYYFGDIEVPYDMIGSVDTRINWKKTVSPYFGLALTDVRIDKRFGFNIGLGGYYLSAPMVELAGTKLLEHNQANEPIIERNIKNYRLLPQLQLGVSYRLHFN